MECGCGCKTGQKVGFDNKLMWLGIHIIFWVILSRIFVFCRNQIVISSVCASSHDSSHDGIFCCSFYGISKANGLRIESMNVCDETYKQEMIASYLNNGQVLAHEAYLAC